MATTKLSFNIVINVDTKISTEEQILKLAQEIADSVYCGISDANRLMVKPRGLIETKETSRGFNQNK